MCGQTTTKGCMFGLDFGKPHCPLVPVTDTQVEHLKRTWMRVVVLTGEIK